MSETLLKVENVSKSFSGVKALSNVSFTIKSGEIRCLMGENGSGKSTVIKIISGVTTPDEGRIVIGGNSYDQLRPKDAIREGIQVIYQDFSLFPNLTVAENIALNMQLAEKRSFVNWGKIRKIAKEVLERIHVKIDLDAPVESLSVADKQLVAISRALVQNAKLLIMDEPTTALTEKEVQSLFAIIKQLQAKGMAILFVSHKLNEVFELSEYITVIRNGKNVADGKVSEFDPAKLMFHMTGREITEKPFEYERNDTIQSLLKVEGFGKTGTFGDITFDLYPGEILGITGLLGSGRTELALALFGAKPAEVGTISMNGNPIIISSIQEAIRQGIAYVPEDRLTEGLFLTQSIGKNIIAGSSRKLSSKMGWLDKKKSKNEIEDWVKNLNIATPSPDLPVQSLSGGNQQRVVLAKWLMQKPKILILNGPTVGVDVGSKSEIHRILRELAKQGIGVIVISDDLPELLNNCNRILLMRKGRIVDEFLAKTTSENDLAQKLSGAVAEGVL